MPTHEVIARIVRKLGSRRTARGRGVIVPNLKYPPNWLIPCFCPWCNPIIFRRSPWLAGQVT